MVRFYVTDFRLEYLSSILDKLANQKKFKYNSNLIMVGANLNSNTYKIREYIYMYECKFDYR